MLLENWSIVKRTKAITLSITNEVIAHLNEEAAERKVNPDYNLAQPVFEQNSRILLDGEDDNYINDTNLNPASMIEPNILLDNDALIDYEIEQQIDDPENRMDEDPRVVKNNYIVDQILNELDNNNDEFIEYDDIPIDNQNLLDDILAIDSDNEESVQIFLGFHISSMSEDFVDKELQMIATSDINRICRRLHVRDMSCLFMRD
jgi:hypothetical protein